MNGIVLYIFNIPRKHPTIIFLKLLLINLKKVNCYFLYSDISYIVINEISTVRKLFHYQIIKTTINSWISFVYHICNAE